MLLSYDKTMHNAYEEVLINIFKNMNEQINRTLIEIDSLFKSVNIDFSNNTWRDDIPPKPGWYLIETDTPVEILKTIGSPLYKARINIPAAIEASNNLMTSRFCITQSGNHHYVVYNGEAVNLKARAREHVHGHAKTFCLGLSDYPILNKYSWRFSWVPVSACKTLKAEDKSIRILFEQAWRSRHGWPVLCKK